MEMVDERFGKSATFHTCSATGVDMNELLHFLEMRGARRGSPVAWCIRVERVSVELAVRHTGPFDWRETATWQTGRAMP
jgi:hypothetical protein